MKGQGRRGEGRTRGEPAPKFDGTCNHCGKKGHKKVDCRSRIAEEKKAKGGKAANSVEEEDEDMDKTDVECIL